MLPRQTHNRARSAGAWPEAFSGRHSYPSLSSGLNRALAFSCVAYLHASPF
jgi:hypothetical protein